MSTKNTTTNSVSINPTKRALEVTREFYKKTLVFGSPEYNELNEAKKAYPAYRVTYKTSSRKKIEDRIDTKDMMIYIENHSGKDSPEMKAFLELRGKTVKDAGNRADAEESANLSVMRKWFFEVYPELSNKTEKRTNRINEILAEAAKMAADRAEAANLAASA